MALTRFQPTAKKPIHNKPRDAISKPKPTSLTALNGQVDKRLHDWAKSDVHSRIALGGLLKQVRAQLEHGDWLEWVSRRMPFSPRSLQQFIELHQWAGRHAVRFAKLAPLGAAKLYLLMRQPDSLVIGLLARAKHVVPSTGARKELMRMTLSDLTEVVRTLRDVPDLDATEVLLDSYRSKVRGVVRVMEALVEHRAEIPVEEVEEMHDELLAAAGLSEAFKLEN